MKKISILLLLLAFALVLSACGCDHVWMAATCETPKTCETCGEVEGEPKGHSMVEASCEEPKHCENCNLTEGTVLEHVWLDATSEAPQTCEACGATEGERIITDPRFTTASTAELQGTWMIEVPLDGEKMELSDFPWESSIEIFVVFGNDGTMDSEVKITDDFLDKAKLYTKNLLYDEFAEYGIDEAEVDEYIVDTYGMPIDEYMDSEITAEMFNENYTDLIREWGLGGVYYVEDDQICIGEDWDDQMEPMDYSLSGDLLVIPDMSEFFETANAFKRVTTE